MIEDELRAETKKWLEKIEQKLPNVNVNSKEKGDQFLKNIHAYVSDSKHFLEKGDLVRAFEAVIWAWSWLEIGLEMGELKSSE